MMAHRDTEQKNHKSSFQDQGFKLVLRKSEIDNDQR